MPNGVMYHVAPRWRTMMHHAVMHRTVMHDVVAGVYDLRHRGCPHQRAKSDQTGNQ